MPTTIVSYQSPKEFLDISRKYLEENELENNLILGICNNLIERKILPENAVFINLIMNEEVIASSIKTLSKAIVSSKNTNEATIKPIADYYKQHQIELSGVVGERISVTKFAEYFGKNISNETTMLIHQLIEVNDVIESEGELVLAEIQDLDLIINWTMEYEKEANVFPIQSREQISANTIARINEGNFYTWMVDNEIKSMAAVVRKTKNVGILGLVYTPKSQRGKGFARTCVKKISEKLLLEGFKQCGLFTDKANTTSNKIYAEIGYVPLIEFSDLHFENLSSKT